MREAERERPGPMDRIEDWYHFEASLVVHVLKSLPATNCGSG